MICEKCGGTHDGTYGSGRFCSSICARAFSTKDNKEEINKKRSSTLKKRSPIWTTPKDEFIKLIQESKSFAEVLRKLGIHFNSGNSRKSIIARLKQEQIDYLHFLNNENVNLLTRGSTYSLSDIFKERCTISRHTIKKRILNDGILENKCANLQ